MFKKACPLFSALLAIFFLASCASKEKTPDVSESLTQTYSSPNGYSVNYPEGYTPTKLSDAIDFVLMDEKSGTSVSVRTTEDVIDTDGEDAVFDYICKNEGVEIDRSSFACDIRDEGGESVISADYTLDGNAVSQTYRTENGKVYCATYVELPGTENETISLFKGIIDSLTA